MQTADRKYILGQALAKIRDAKNDAYGQPTGEEFPAEESQTVAQIDAEGGWDADVQRGYDDAKRELAAERRL